MHYRLLALLTLTFAVGARAQTSAALYDFDALPPGAWTGGDGWSVNASGGHFQVTASDSADGSNFIAFYDFGGGVGATAYRAFSTPSANEQFSLGFRYFTGNYWGTSLGIGSARDKGLTLAALGYDGFHAEVYANGSILGSSPVPAVNGTTWYDFRLDVDLGANSGQGAATLYQRPAGTTDWTALAGLANFGLGLDASRTATDETNPLNWNTLWFHHEGATSGIDNIFVTPAASAIPEPSTYAAFAGLAALAGAAWRRRRSTRP